MGAQPQNDKQREGEESGKSGPIAVRIVPPVSDAVKRIADQEKRPVQWQVDLLLREGLKALGENPD